MYALSPSYIFPTEKTYIHIFNHVHLLKVCAEASIFPFNILKTNN